MDRAKLGLALAGGGFRAALFHVGVLRRMAELDLLRYVEVLSTVSGGSITGALYLLLLKERLEDPKLAEHGPKALALTREVYIEIVDELQRTLVCGVQKNLRTRLLMNPLEMAKVMLSSYTLGTAMAKLYERHFFACVVKRLRNRNPQRSAAPDGAPDRAGSISIRAMRLRREAVSDAGGSEDYNHLALDPSLDGPRGGPGSAVTRLIVNATSLNSGARFWFSHAEIGDWYLGHIRYEEIHTELLPRKILLELKPERLNGLINALGKATQEEKVTLWCEVARPVLQAWGIGPCTMPQPEGVVPKAQALCLARWWRSGRKGAPVAPALSDVSWASLPAAGFQLERVAGQLANAEAGRLREVKAYAWYLLVGRERSTRITAGYDDATLQQRFWGALQAIDDTGVTGVDPQFETGLCHLVLEIFNLRMAEAMSPRVEAEWDRLPLSFAVAASAAFPPAFPPFQVRDLYDDLHVRVLGLTDGGVFDNLGTTALLDEQCNYIIASDPGGIFETKQVRSSVGRLGLTGRLMQILGERPINLYRHDLHERRRMQAAGGKASALLDGAQQFLERRALKGLALFRIDSDRPEIPGVDVGWPGRRADLARLRTDLDIFGDIEVKALVNEAYLLADHFLRTELQGSPFDPVARSPGGRPWQPAGHVPLPLCAPDKTVARVLQAGRSRFLRALHLQAPLSVSVTLATCAILVACVWWLGWDWAALTASLAAAGAWALPKVGTGLLSMIPPLFLIPVLQWIELRWVAALVFIFIAAWIFLRHPVLRWLEGWKVTESPRRQWWRRGASVLKYAGSLKGWMFVLLVPVAVLVVSVGALLAHWLFACPFRRRTSDRKHLHDPP